MKAQLVTGENIMYYSLALEKYGKGRQISNPTPSILGETMQNEPSGLLM